MTVQQEYGFTEYETGRKIAARILRFSFCSSSPDSPILFVYRMTGTQAKTGIREVSAMIFAFIMALYGMAVMFEMMEGIAAAFAHVINSGSGVLAIAFITAVYTYRRIQARRGA